MRLTVMHNLYFFNTLFERIRQALDEDKFEEFYKNNNGEWIVAHHKTPWLHTPSLLPASGREQLWHQSRKKGT